MFDIVDTDDDDDYVNKDKLMMTMTMIIHVFFHQAIAGLISLNYMLLIDGIDDDDEMIKLNNDLN